MLQVRGQFAEPAVRARRRRRSVRVGFGSDWLGPVRVGRSVGLRVAGLVVVRCVDGLMGFANVVRYSRFHFRARRFGCARAGQVGMDRADAKFMVAGRRVHRPRPPCCPSVGWSGGRELREYFCRDSGGRCARDARGCLGPDQLQTALALASLSRALSRSRCLSRSPECSKRRLRSLLLLLASLQ